MDKTNLWDVENGIPNRKSDVRRGADPAENVSGKTGTESSNETSWKSVKVGNGSSIIVTIFSNAGPLVLRM